MAPPAAKQGKAELAACLTLVAPSGMTSAMGEDSIQTLVMQIQEIDQQARNADIGFPPFRRRAGRTQVQGLRGR